MEPQKRVEPAEPPATDNAPRVRRGTGPRTKLGKERAKYNAVTHGIFTNVAVLKHESQQDFHSHLQGLRDALRPVGALEERLVESIATRQWRKRRYQMAENAEIEAATEFLEWDEAQRQMVEAGNLIPPACNGGLIKQITNSEALRRCLELLTALKDSITHRGFVPETDKNTLAVIYGEFDPKHWRSTLFESYLNCSNVANYPPEKLEGLGVTQEDCQEEFFKCLDKEIARLMKYREDKASVDREKQQLERLRRHVPDGPRLERLLRYEAHLDRGIERDLVQLERAQQMRLAREAED